MRQLMPTLVGLLLVGCAGPEAQDLLAGKTGAFLSMDFYGDTDVVGFHYEVQRVACYEGEYFQPAWLEFNVDLVDGIFPGQVELVEQTLDSSSRHLGADLFVTLETGCYDVIAVPASSFDGDLWTPSYDCSAVKAEAVEVLAEQTTDVTLVSQCVGDPIGALDTLVLLNHPPQFDLEIDEKFNFECEPVNVCATVHDPNDDPIEVDWSKVAFGENVLAINAQDPEIVGFDDGHRIWRACAEIVTDHTASYDIEINVYDLGWKDGNLVRMEEIVAPEESRATLVFPIFTSILDENLCFDHEGQLIYAEGVDPTILYKDCDPTTAEEYYCSGNYSIDSELEQQICWGSYLREDVYYPVCPGEEAPENLSPVSSLKGVDVPSHDHSDFIADKSAAIALGKALFWDLNLGQQGQACASCHFSAGSDSRVKNTVSPGLNDLNVSPVFDTFASGSGGPNYTLALDDFPLHLLSDITDRNSSILRTTGNDVISSMGTFNGTITLSDEIETCNSDLDSMFFVGSANTRRVEPRNAPTTINAIFNFRNFWDGRANNVFNGVDPLGRRTDTTGILKMVDGGSIVDAHVELINSSLASQAVGPVLSNFEMNCGATGIEPDFRRAARRLFQTMPLAGQDVHANDPVLGSLSSGLGLNVTYEEMIEDAFHSKWWDSDTLVGNFTLMENNFSMFFGLSVMAYEATLISDDSPFDRFVEGDYSAMTSDEIKGLGVFLGKGKCASCHHGPEFTGAATDLFKEHEEGGLVERMFMAKTDDITPSALYDNAFYNIGVTPTAEDIGVGAVIGGHPVSFTRQEKDRAGGGNPPDPFETDPDTFEVDSGVPVSSSERDAVDGAFKTSGLRNIALTGPYFHNGGTATLRQVVEFYNRGGDRRSGSSNGFSAGCDNSGLDSNCSNLDPDITTLDLTDDEIDQLVAFMEALTDERVADESGVFSHPSLPIPLGHDGDESTSTASNGDECDDEMIILPAVGSGGRSAEGLDPVPSFEDLLACVDGDSTMVVGCFSDAYEL
ncbi:MAG: hypothetical protein KTR31_16320 [Myxococcales bacterium]|nr:hypothetical protein [Myxococcales bacterium]